MGLSGRLSNAHTHTHKFTNTHKERKEDREKDQVERIFEDMHLYFTAFYHGAM